ncbi:hypothetical protein bAD24_p01200 (plasmid) [Burkholderia sp. AD24]|nr:hypothetical protein bAD24_p01200 [Burkholderia sp. AD24]
MKEIGMSQRIEEIELALSTLLESPKTPAICSYDDEACFIQASRVIESHTDTTLDSRCELLVRFATRQLRRYAEMDTAQRIVVRDRLIQMVRGRFPLENGAPPFLWTCELIGSGTLKLKRSRTRRWSMRDAHLHVTRREAHHRIPPARRAYISSR